MNQPNIQGTEPLSSVESTQDIVGLIGHLKSRIIESNKSLSALRSKLAPVVINQPRIVISDQKLANCPEPTRCPIADDIRDLIREIEGITSELNRLREDCGV